MFTICAPVIIYLGFSISQILIDTYSGLYNMALMKLIVMIIISIMLNILCSKGLGIISWMIVFIPFIFMSVIVVTLLYIFGLKATTGKIKDDKNNDNNSNNNNNNKTIVNESLPPLYTSDPAYQS
jgi:L-cystine uptake protein TcyP (sodium:dicarboxylate symporter family)